MSIDARLSRLTPALSVKERALLVTAATSTAASQTQASSTCLQTKRAEYDYFIALVYTSNTNLGVMARSLHWIVDALERDQEQCRQLARAAGFVEVALEETADPEVVRK